MAFYEQKNSGAAFSKTKCSRSVNMNFPVHFHTSFEMLYLEEGEIEVNVDGRVYLPKVGDMLLIPPDSAHSYKTEKHSVIGLIIFCADYLREIYEETGRGVYRHPVIEGKGELFEGLREAEGEHCLFRAQLYMIAAEYFQNQPLHGGAERNHGFITRFSDYVGKHYAEPLHEKDVAKALGYHPRYLSHLIKKNFGVGFRAVLNEYRVRNACYMLQTEGCNITEVYLAVGFESQCAFNRNFREIMGVTPMKYRQGHRIGENIHSAPPRNQP